MVYCNKHADEPAPQPTKKQVSKQYVRCIGTEGDLDLHINIRLELSKIKMRPIQL